ncbi:MAG: insulinase family protein [Candidatus Scalindua sp.]|nr:MAG: insulinase family protein [Candidatus Scalindua sp.]
MMFTIRRLLLIPVIICFCATSYAQKLQLDVQEHVLENGLKILMLEKHDVPIVSLRVVYKVGSANERPGITGASHLFEHMMFKGTKIFGTKNYEEEKPLLVKEEELIVTIEAEKTKGINSNKETVALLESELQDVWKRQKELLVKDEMWSIYLKNGATGLNASTSSDGTFYYCNLPSNRLELWAFMESDRMQNLVLREFYSERDVVMEERRLRTDNSPFGLLFEQLNAAAFTAHPYGWPVIGWMSDLENIKKSAVTQYFRQYYSPNNAVIVAVGDINPDEIIALVEKHFGDIPRQPPSPKVTTEEPTQMGERRVYVEFDANPVLSIAYHKPAIGHPDQYVFDVIEAILSSGRTSRLYKSLIEDKQIAVMAHAYGGPSKYADTFLFLGTPRSPHTAEEVEEAIYEELNKLKTTPVTQHELLKIKNQLEADFVRSLESASGLASKIASYEAIYGWGYINTLVENTLSVTPEDILRVANKYFIKTNRTVAILVKKEKGNTNENKES